MAFGRLILVAITLVTALVLDTTGACRCLYRGLCDTYEDASVVMRGTVLSREDDGSISDTTYTANTSTLYKGEPNVVYDQVVSFGSMTSNSCGVILTIGEEYLLFLLRSSNTVDGELSTNLCSPPYVWSSVNETELNSCS